MRTSRLTGSCAAPDGRFTEFEAPGATGIGTAAFSINVSGAVTGEFFDANNVMHGFFRSADAGTGAFQGTRPSTNNAEGTVAGWYVDENSLNHGFIWRP
jgi:hypothetical protein